MLSVWSIQCIEKQISRHILLTHDSVYFREEYMLSVWSIQCIEKQISRHILLTHDSVYFREEYMLSVWSIQCIEKQISRHILLTHDSVYFREEYMLSVWSIQCIEKQISRHGFWANNKPQSILFLNLKKTGPSFLCHFFIETDNLSKIAINKLYLEVEVLGLDIRLNLTIREYRTFRR